MGNHGDAWFTPLYAQSVIIAAAHFFMNLLMKNAAAHREVN